MFKIINSNKLNLFLILLSFFLFFLGFVTQENAAGGGVTDFSHIYKNFLLIKNTEFLNIDWSKYESTSLPIYYLIIKYVIPQNQIFFFKLFTFLVSLFCPIIFYLALKFKYKIKKFNYKLYLASCLILLSPYFRTSGFYGLEENYGYLFLLLSALFFFYSNNKNIYLNILSIFFSSLAFYTRQNYCFLPIIIYFSLFNFKNIFDYRNIVYTISFVIFLIPSLYFFVVWQGITPPLAQVERSLEFRFDNLIKIFSIVFIYIFPIYIFYFNKKFSFLKRNFLYLFLSWVFFLILCFKININLAPVGGGVFFKLFLFFKINFLSKIFIYTISFLGFLLICYISYKNKYLLIYFIITIIGFSLPEIIFQEYFDPLTLIVIILFSTNQYLLSSNSNKFVLFLFGYYFVFLIFSIFYHNVNQII